MPVSLVKTKPPAHKALLAAAYELLKDSNGDISKVTMKDVVKKAGLTSGAFYNVWPGGMPSFQQSLLESALAAEHISYLAVLFENLSAAGPDTVSLSELARINCAEDAEHLKADPGFRVQVALWARHGADPATAEALRAAYQKVGGMYADAYRSLVDKYGLEWREPFNADTFATLLTGIAEGLAMRSAVDPDSVPAFTEPGGEARDWDLLGICAALLLKMVTNRRDEKNEPVWAAISGLDTTS